MILIRSLRTFSLSVSVPLKNKAEATYILRFITQANLLEHEVEVEDEE